MQAMLVTLGHEKSPEENGSNLTVFNAESHSQRDFCHHLQKSQPETRSTKVAFPLDVTGVFTARCEPYLLRQFRLILGLGPGSIPVLPCVIYG